MPWLYIILIVLGLSINSIAVHFNARASHAQGLKQNAVLYEKIDSRRSTPTLESPVKFINTGALQDASKSNLPKSDEDPPGVQRVISTSSIAGSNIGSTIAMPPLSTQTISTPRYNDGNSDIIESKFL